MLTVDRIKEKIDMRSLPKPAMVIDSEIILDKYRQLSALIDGVELFYSVKTNPHGEILELLKKAGSGFEVASPQELKQVIDMGVPPEKIISGNTFKMPEMIAEAYSYGVNYFAFDSIMEIEKIARYAPGSDVCLRVVVPNDGSDWPLSSKFGVPVPEALELLIYAAEKGLNPNGLTFHVGSQCLNPFSWSNALVAISEVYYMAKSSNIKIDVINLGGGFPSRLTKDIPEIGQIRNYINKTIREKFSGEKLKYYIEPGRGLVGEAALFIASVIAATPRGSENWVVLDIGVYNGLLEAVADIEYHIVSDKQLNGFAGESDLIPYTVGGPTCDSWDTIVKGCKLPKKLSYGDIIYILNTGAYTNSEATCFNGFEAPAIHMA